MPATKLYLARHGETEWNLEKRLQGRLNSPLTDSGISQALSLGERLCNHNIKAIYSSPLGRASQTALACQDILGIEITHREDLQERHFGDWQSSLFDELNGHENFENIFFMVTHHSPPNGESGTECANRINASLNDIVQQHVGQSVLAVTHGDAIRCFMSLITQESGTDAYSQYGNGKIFELDFCHNLKSFQFIRAF